MNRRQSTTKIVVHCSATRPSSDIGVKQIRDWHMSNGWSDIGYHIVIRRDGTVELGRDLQAIGAHVAGHNSDSIGVCMVGGLDDEGRSFDNRPEMFTPQQWESARLTLKFLRSIYPHARICGHRDLSPDKNGDGKITRNEWLKTCPGFDAETEFFDI